MASRSTRRPLRTAGIGLLVVLIALAVGPGLWPLTELYAQPVSVRPEANIAWDGDSQSAPGFGRRTTPEHTEALFDDEVFVRSEAVGGSTTIQLAARAYKIERLRVRLPGVPNVLVAWVGTNDLGLGDPPAEVLARLRAYCEDHRSRGWQVVVATALPRTFVLDPPGYEGRRLAFNELLRTQWQSFADAFADVGADPTIGVQGAQDDPTYYEPSDRSHLLDPGKAIVARYLHEAISTLGVS